MPVREKGRRRPVRFLQVPSHVPSQPQTAAKVPGFSLTATRFTAETDWLLEEAGFEPSVPGDGGFGRIRAHATRVRNRRTLIVSQPVGIAIGID
jgi:hypothetical protein